MALSAQEISDRFEIQDLLIDYCSALDNGDFAALHRIFMPDARIDYSSFDGPQGKPAQLVPYLKQALSAFTSYQHMLGNIRIWLDGERAKARTICHHPMVIPQPDGGSQTIFCGLWYADKLVRTETGWRLAERVLEEAYMHNMPEDFLPVKS